MANPMHAATDLSAEVIARSVAEIVLRASAHDVDTRNRFPRESIDALHEAGLLKYFMPRRFSGLEGDFHTFSRIAAILGEECLSTALIWAMHCQQVAVLVNHAADVHGDVLDHIARTGALVASGTTEYGKGGDLLRAEAPIIREGHRLRLRRKTPVTSYGAEASYFLVTMRSGPDKPTTDVSLVLVTREDEGDIRVSGEWNAMGMRGTRSVPMEFDVLLPGDRIIGSSFREVALRTMIPAGHVGWTAAWFGGARGAFKKFVKRLRPLHARGGGMLNSDLFLSRLANLRVSLDLLEAMLDTACRRLDELQRRGAELQQYEEITHNILLNNLKVAGSRLAFSVADGLMELGGLAEGFLKDRESGIERVFRDLRSAALMYHNDRLLDANGKLILVEDSPITNLWS